MHNTCIQDGLKQWQKNRAGEVSHLGTECLVGLPSACQLRRCAVLKGCVGGWRLSVVCGQHHSLKRQTHLLDKAKHRSKTSTLHKTTNLIYSLEHPCRIIKADTAVDFETLCDGDLP